MRLLDRIVDLLAVVAGTLIVAVMLGVSLDVGLRYFFNAPILWMFEASQFALLAVLFLGSPFVTRNNGHVAVDLLVNGLKPDAQRVVRTVALAIAGLIALFLSWWAMVVTHDNWSRHVLTSGIYQIPRHYMLGLIAAGLFLTGIEFLRLARRAWRGEVAAADVDVSTAL